MLPPCTCWIHGIDYDCSSSCPDCYGNGEGGDDGNGDGDGGGNDDGNDDGNGDGGGEIPDENNCPTYVALTMQDANNPFRYAAPGQPLVMVGGTREANLKLVNLSGAVQGYPIWSGTGISGSGIAGQYVGSTNSTVYALTKPGCDPVIGQINIVPENLQGLSIEVDLKELSEKFNGFLSSKTKGSNFNCGLSVNSYIINKNVDMYLDGSKVGGYTNFEADASASFGGGDMKITVYNTPPISAYVKLTFNGVECWGNFHLTKDESIANPYSGSGSLSFGIAGATGELTGEMGIPYICSAGITGAVNMEQISLTGTATVDANGIKLGLKMNPTTITANCYLFAKNNLNDLTCKQKLGEDIEIFKIGVEEEIGSIIVYIFNN